MSIERKLNTMRFVPIYAMAKNSISLTKCTINCGERGSEEGKISISVAVTGTAVITPITNGITLRDLGTATLTVKNVPLRGKVPMDGEDKLAPVESAQQLWRFPPQV